MAAREVYGSSLADLNNTLLSLSTIQKRTATVWINAGVMLKFNTPNRYQLTICNSTNGHILDYRLDIGTNPTYNAVESNGSSVISSISVDIASWRVYYHGSPIS